MSEEENRPFKAEYAKSGRAACKLCKGNIAQESLRLAKMVQSPFFDGKMPHWFHFACFFKKNQLKAPSEVSGFGTLRWEDQQRLKDKIVGAESTDSGPTPSKGKGKKAATIITRGDLQVEYAKSGRSTCKGCLSKIEQGEVRVAKMMDPDPTETRGFAGQLPSWHHVDCFLERLEDLDAAGVAAEELTGFSKLKKGDKDELSSKLAVKKDGDSKSRKGKKRKVEEHPVAVKQSKNEDEMEAMKKQSELVWKFRDQLRESLRASDLKVLLKANNQEIPSGESRMLDRCADGMAFGALKPCPECNGQLIPRTHCYQCTGNMSAWTKCTYTATEAERVEWVIPEEFQDIDTLKEYKCRVRKRVFDKELTPPQSTDSTDGPPSTSTKKPKVDAPLHGFSVAIVGRLGKTKPELTRMVESLGGRVVSKASKTTTICISDQKEVDKASKRMSDIEDLEVPVVSIDFLEDAAKGGALLKIPTYTISSWGAPRHSLAIEEPDLGGAFKSKGPSKMKVTVKGAAAVDPESGLEDSHHVLEEGETVWNAVLGMVDIVRGTNSYYKLQLLEADRGRGYYVFRSWGRVGTSIGGTKCETHGMSKDSAKREFLSVYLDKTGNPWQRHGDFVKQPGKFYPLDIDYGGPEDMSGLQVVAGTRSQLSPAVQELIKMIFDVESMKKAMLEFEIDMKKMPLGKLSKRQIQNAYTLLTELQMEINGTKSPSKLLDASNRFFTLIPHDFGLKMPPVLDSSEVIAAKTQMLDNLLEIEVAYSLLKQEEGTLGEKDPLDLHYEKLKTDIEVLSSDCEEHQMLQNYVQNTHGATHTQYSLELQQVYKVCRHGEGKRYKPFQKLHNRQLLWHGSRTTNYVGILSQGLRIAPPEAPVTGYMFGKGVYFADMVSKSANYCHTSRSDNIGLLLVCEVALGEMYERTHAEYISKLPSGKHSTKGLGRTAPDPSQAVILEDGVVVPLGKGLSSSATRTSLLYNEYIVYDVSQIRMKYLLKVDFKFRW